MMERIKVEVIEVLAYELLLNKDWFLNSEVAPELDNFKARRVVIIKNRMVDEIGKVKDKVFRQDLFDSD